MIISASQLQTFELCPRKWWFDKVLKLPRIERHSFDFGTTLHEVCERYLLADDLGIDPTTTEPVELYPEGWSNGLSPADQDLIKRLISAAITEGVLERKPGRLIEHEFRKPVIPGVQIMGFVDVLYPDSVEDHKTSKSTRYFQSVNSLPENLQMLIYGKVCLDRNPSLDRVLLRHNQYCKDASKPQVRKTEAWASKEQIEEAWENRVVATARKMQEIREANYQQWQDTPEPDYSQRPCMAYGGCEFLAICSKRETTDLYKKRVDRANGIGDTMPVQVTVPITRERTSTMGSLTDKLREKRVGQSEPVPAPVEEKTEATASTPVAGIELPEGASLPPWCDAENLVTSVNSGLGFKTNGTPCLMSVARAKRDGRPLPEDFDIVVPGDGTVVWASKDGKHEGWTPLSLDPMPEVKATERVQVEEPAEVEEPVEEVEEPVEEVEEPAPVEEKKPVPSNTVPVKKDPEEVVESITKSTKRGRKPPRFTLCVNCTPVIRTNANMPSLPESILLNDILAELGASIAKANKAESLYQVNAFGRRDELTRLAEIVAKNLNEENPSAIVYVMGVGSGASDLKAVLDGFMPHAGLIVQGVVG